MKKIGKKLVKKDHLSFSAVNSFEKCPRAYWEEFTGRYEKNSTSKALLAGQLFHKYIELLGDPFELPKWIEGHKHRRNFFMKKKPDMMYAEYQTAMDSAQDFLDLKLYKELDLSLMGETAEELEEYWKAQEEYVKETGARYYQEERLDGFISKIPFTGIVDFATINNEEVCIHDWKFIKDFKKTYNEQRKRYEEWYEKYVIQQMIYLKLFCDKYPELKDRKKFSCEIVGISKGGKITVKRIHFSFNSIEEMLDTTTWKIYESTVRYAWNKLNKTELKDRDELPCCGECGWCKENNVILDEVITVE